MIQDARGLESSFLNGVNTLGVTAGASTPEILVREVIGYLAERFSTEVEEIVTTTEGTQFKLPRFPKREGQYARQ
jgi:4-hydroxy-3-methylbut-2-enyl diphosphate reductase